MNWFRLGSLKFFMEAILEGGGSGGKRKVANGGRVGWEGGSSGGG